MNCPKCKNTKHTKDGTVKVTNASGKVISRQRFKCKKCGYRYTVVEKANAVNSFKKVIAALEHSNDGASFRKIARKYGVSHVAIFKWYWNSEEKGT